MFNALAQLPDDPILGLMSQFRSDSRSDKVDLGVGVYRTEEGLTPIFSAIKQAEKSLWEQQQTKTYVAPLGNHRFLSLLAELLLGDSYAGLSERIAGVQTPGGCGALRVAAELIMASKKNAAIWVSDPTWGNHTPLLGNSGLRINTYPYYDPLGKSLCFDQMMTALAKVPAGDFVLLHGCCHNPTGADLSEQQWLAIAKLAAQTGFIPFVDMAYQGFAHGLTVDSRGVQILTQHVQDMVVTVSCSKNFGLYRERVGAAFVLLENKRVKVAVESHFANIVRGIYSMPPDHGAELVARVLETDLLRASWELELESMRVRVANLRCQFSSVMRELRDDPHFDFIERQNGMFSFLGLNPSQVSYMIEQRAIYLLGSSRASIPGLNQDNLGYVCESINMALRSTQ